MVNESVMNFLQELLISVISVIIVVILLMPRRVAEVSALSIPITIFTSIGIFYLFSMELNTVTLAAEGSLADVPKDHWSYAAIDMLVQDGIIEGNPDGTFEGGRAMSRYEMAAIVARAVENSKDADLKTKGLVEMLKTE